MRKYPQFNNCNFRIWTINSRHRFIARHQTELSAFVSIFYMKRLNNRGWCCTELVRIIFQDPRKLRNRINWNERVASKKRSWRTIALFIVRSTLQNTLMIALNGFASMNVRRTHVHRSIFFSPPSVLFDFYPFCGSCTEFLVRIFSSLRYLTTRHQVRR